MPIKPENKARYPKNWRDIRNSILLRAGNRCEQCSLENGERIVRGKGEDVGTFMRNDAEVYCAETGKSLGQCRMSDYESNGKWIDIVLTIAHLDHTPENCDAANLKALCQRCHLAYDADHHAETARATRHARKAIADLFGHATNQQANTAAQSSTEGNGLRANLAKPQ